MKKSVEKKSYFCPHPVFVVGTYDEHENPNIMAVSWGGMVCSDPPCVSISVRKVRHTYPNLMANMAFTVNIPSKHQIKEADLTGVASGKRMNKFDEAGLTPKKYKDIHAPYVEEFPVSMICKVVNIIELGVHIMFIGEVIDVLVDESMLDENGIPDISKIEPFAFNSADRHYYAIGEKLMEAYTVKKIKN